jgi:hypothetical protein
MNILVLTKSGEYCEEAQQSIPFNSKRIEISVFKDECDKPRFVYCKYGDEKKLYEFIKQNNPQVIFIDADDIYDLKIAEKTLKHYGQSCPDLVGFRKHIVNGQNLKAISRDYDYVHFKVSSDQQDEQFFNYLRRKVIRYKSGCGSRGLTRSQGLITRNEDGFLFNNETMIKPAPNERRFLTVLFEEGGNTTWKNLCYEFEEDLDTEAIISKNFKDVKSMTKGEEKKKELQRSGCSEMSKRKDSMKLNVFLSDLLRGLNSRLKGIAEGKKGLETGFKLEGKLISSSGSGKDAKWHYEDKIKLFKIDISND